MCLTKLSMMARRRASGVRAMAASTASVTPASFSIIAPPRALAVNFAIDCRSVNVEDLNRERGRRARRERYRAAIADIAVGGGSGGRASLDGLARPQSGDEPHAGRRRGRAHPPGGEQPGLPPRRA